MLSKHRHRLLARLTPFIPYVLLLAGCAVVVIALAGCPRKRISPSRAVSEGVPTMRVRLTGGAIRSASFASPGPFHIRIGQRDATAAEGATGATEISRRGGRWFVNGAQAGWDGEISLRPISGGLISYNEKPYRGTLELVPAGNDAYHVVNHVDLESYLAGVLPRELYPDWSPQTYRAQAVVARTYALYKKSVYGNGRYFDVMSGQSDQVYGGFDAETDKAWQAVRSTRGWVLAFGPKGEERIFLAQYSACNGGFVNGANVIRDAPDVEPLRGGRRDPDGPFYPRFKWGPVKIAKADVLRAAAGSYPAVRGWKRLREIRVAQRTRYGRSVWLDLVSGGGKIARIRAEDLRLALLRIRSQVPAAGKIRSMNCRIRNIGKDVEFYDGRGFGHGVGLSQWGAEAKAQRGWSARRILDFYYPGAKIFRAY